MKNKKGFTVVELVIVIAVIAVLTAILIPTFASVIENANETTDLANIRTAYIEMMAESILNEETIPLTINLKQSRDGWSSDKSVQTLIDLTGNHVTGSPSNSGVAIIEWDSEAECVKITFSDEAQGYKDIRTFMKAAAKGLQKGFEKLIPENKKEQANSCLHKDSYIASNGDTVNVIELSISENNLKNGGVYWNPSKYTWGELLEEAGVDLSMVDSSINGYVYLDEKYNAISVSYNDEDGNYCYTFFESDETIVFSRMPGERQHAGYYIEYAKSLAK